jgi:hypothetical protein
MRYLHYQSKADAAGRLARAFREDEAPEFSPSAACDLRADLTVALAQAKRGIRRCDQDAGAYRR